MAGSVNKVILLGNLGKDPDIRATSAGSRLASFSIATSTKYRNKETQQLEDKTEWHRVVFFNKPAETIGQYVKKGQQLYVEGRLQTRKWQDKDGIEKYSTDIISDNFTFVGSKSDSMGDSQFDNQSQKSDDFNQSTPSNQDDDVPF